MAIITDIEAKILQLEGGAFQELCDSYLFKKTGYKNITQYGKQAGTMKTAKGTPDTYFIKPNGKYALIQYTTAQEGIFDKIKKDIEKCLNPQKIKLAKEEIDEILYCYNSSRLSVGEYEKLKEICDKVNIKLEIYSINTIAHDIYFEYPIIAKDYLGISVDTGQIMKSEDFIEEYDSNKMLAPLSMKFLFRESEKNELIDAINSNDIIIFSGQAGVGKTKLALEVVNEYKKKYDYKLFCIRSKNLEIYEDIKKYINNDIKYILFIDDGNELKQLKLILELLNKKNIKIVITVRNYVKEIVSKNVKKYTNNIFEKEIPAFSDKELTEFLKENMGILNPKYIEQILKLSKGNARIAYMAGKIAIEKNTLESIYNVENIYESYYGIMPIELDESLYITGSIISIFGIIEIENKNLDKIFKICNLTKESFIVNVKMLEKFEYVEIKHENVVRMLDQCFANYLLYKTFIKDKLIRLNLIIEYGFEYFREDLIKMLLMFSNIYSSKETLEYIKQEVNIIWNKYEKEDKYLLEDFIKVFYSLNEIKALSYIYGKVEKSVKREIEISAFNFNKEIDDNILKLFPDNRQTQNLEEVLEVLFEYLLKRKDLIEEGYKLILNNYGITRYSFEENYITQIVLLDKISRYMNKREIRILFYKIAEHFLKVEFSEIESCNSYATFHSMSLLNISNTKIYRKKIWKLLLKNISIEENEDILIVLESLNYYFKGKKCIEILEIDKPFIIEILQSLEEVDEIRLSKIYLKLNEQYEIYSREIENSLTKTKTRIYINLSGKKIRYDSNFNEKLKERVKEFSNTVDLKEVFDNIIIFSDEDKREIIIGLEYFIENFYRDIEELKRIFFYCNELNKTMYFYPRTLLLEIINRIGINEAYKLIENDKSISVIKNNWKFIFFELLPKESINIFYKDKLLEFIYEDNENLHYRDINILKNFYFIDNTIYVLVTRILYEKNDLKIIKNWLRTLFDHYCNSPKELLQFYKEDLVLLKKIYFISEKDDYDGRFFKEFLDYDFNYLTQYLEILKNNKCMYIRDSKLKVCWNKENYLEIFDDIFEYIVKNRRLLLYHFWKIFTINIFNVRDWIKHTITKYYNDREKVLILFEIICQLDKEIRIESIIYFLNKNKDIEIFKKIDIEPRSRAWGGSEISLLSKDIELYEELLINIKGIKFIKHRGCLEERIEWLKNKIKKIERKEYLEKYN